jgi:regulator of cell morphogenesis and NO signaling
MHTYTSTDTVGELVAQRPALARVFENEGIDYCCGGGKTLEEACRKKGIDVSTLLTLLAEAASSDENSDIVNVTGMNLTELADHIEQTHHAYLRTELPRLEGITQKVASVHGEKDARLAEVRDTFLTLAKELSDHMMKEERILFPMVRQLEAGDGTEAIHCGSLANPIRQMIMEHEQAGSVLERLRSLTDNHTVPDWACNTYRAMLDGLAQFEHDLHQHIHKENNVLFPKAVEMEERTGTVQSQQ